MARNYFSRADEIHQQFVEEEDASLHFDDLSSDEDEGDQTNVMEEILCEAAEPLFSGSRSSKLQFSIILMSLTTLYGVSHQGECTKHLPILLRFHSIHAFFSGVL